MNSQSSIMHHPSSLYFYRYRMNFTVIEPCHFFAFTGAAARGLFGEALHAISCRFLKDNKPCSNCTLAQNCAYSFFFGDDKPAPFAIVPLSDDPARYHRQDELILLKKGQVFSFEFILFGQANRYFAGSVLEAFRYFSNLPAGMKHISSSAGSKGRLMLHSIETITADEECLVLYANDSFIPEMKPLKIAGKHIMEPEGQTDEVTALIIQTVTPLEIRIKSSHIRAESGLPFGVFYLQLLQRASKLAHFYCGAPPVPYLNTNQPTDQPVYNPSYRFHDIRFSKYSRTQDQIMKLNGIMGQALYTGPLGPFFPLLRLGQYILAGKNTTFGFGKYLIQYDRSV